MKHKGGRPTKITPALIEKISHALLVGCYIETAAAMAGIHKDSFHEWLKRGARALDKVRAKDGTADPGAVPAAERAFALFSDAINKALAEAEARLLMQIDKAAQEGAWQAAAWRLERKHPQRWGRKWQGSGSLRFPAGADGEAQAEAPAFEFTLKIGDKEFDLFDESVSAD